MNYCSDRCKPVCHGRAVQPVWVALWCGGALPLPYPWDGCMGGVKAAPPMDGMGTGVGQAQGGHHLGEHLHASQCLAVQRNSI